MSLTPEERRERFKTLGTAKHENPATAKIFAPLQSSKVKPSEAELKEAKAQMWKDFRENNRK